MKTIIIFTGNDEEITTLEKFASFQDNIWYEKKYLNDGFQLIAIKQKINASFSKVLLTLINSLKDDETIILHHGDIFDSGGDYPILSRFNYKFNCGSLTRMDVDKNDREIYEKIINSIDTINGFLVIWSYFKSKPIYELQLKELHDILSGNEQLLVDQKWVIYDQNNPSHFSHLSNFSDKILNRI